MRAFLTITLFLVASLLLPATSDAWVHRMNVPADSVKSWDTPQWFSWSSPDPTVFKIKVNGHVFPHESYTYERKHDCGIGWSARELAVEAQVPCHRRNPVTIEVANMRERAIRVRVSYWNPTDRVAK